AGGVRLGAAWGEGDEAPRVPPASKVRVAGEERVEFRVGGAPQPREVGGVEALIGARQIAVSAVTGRHVAADITGRPRSSAPCHTAALTFCRGTAVVLRAGLDEGALGCVAADE